MSGSDVGFVGFSVLAFVLMSLAMTLAWAIQRVTGNSGWIDTIWSSATGLVALTVVGLSRPMTSHRWAIALLVALWAARLAWHIGDRTRQNADDPRYRALIRGWGGTARWKLWSFLQVQAAAGAVLVLCILVAASKPGETGLWDMTCYGLALAALIGESTADKQLRTFKAQRQAHPAILETGLWGLSRHPNYFFEWLFWAAISLSALSFKPSFWEGWLTLIAPGMMYVVLVHGSGVPHSEAHMLRTRGESFASYQKRVPKFFPDVTRLLRRRV